MSMPIATWTAASRGSGDFRATVATAGIAAYELPGEWSPHPELGDWSIPVGYSLLVNISVIMNGGILQHHDRVYKR